MTKVYDNNPMGKIGTMTNKKDGEMRVNAEPDVDEDSRGQMM
jgi:hypothetical protein